MNFFKKSSFSVAVTAAVFFLSESIELNADVLCDMERGKKVFKRCAACHSLGEGENKMGPSLHDVMGNKSARNDTFQYSNAMMAVDIEWSKTNFINFIESPMNYVPGTIMYFGGVKSSDDREALFCYLSK